MTSSLGVASQNWVWGFFVWRWSLCVNFMTLALLVPEIQRGGPRSPPPVTDWPKKPSLNRVNAPTFRQCCVHQGTELMNTVQDETQDARLNIHGIKSCSWRRQYCRTFGRKDSLSDSFTDYNYHFLYCWRRNTYIKEAFHDLQRGCKYGECISKMARAWNSTWIYTSELTLCFTITAEYPATL